MSPIPNQAPPYFAGPIAVNNSLPVLARAHQNAAMMSDQLINHLPARGYLLHAQVILSSCNLLKPILWCLYYMALVIWLRSCPFAESSSNSWFHKLAQFGVEKLFNDAPVQSLADMLYYLTTITIKNVLCLEVPWQAWCTALESIGLNLAQRFVFIFCMNISESRSYCITSVSFLQMSKEQQTQYGLPQMLLNFHSLKVLEENKGNTEEISKSLGVASLVMKGISVTDGEAYAIRRFSWMQVWHFFWLKPMNH